MKTKTPPPEVKPVSHHPDELKPGVLPLNPQRIEAAMASYGGVEYVSDDLLKLTRNFLALYEKYFKIFQSAAKKYGMTREQIGRQIEKGFFILNADQMELEPAALAALLNEVVDLATFTNEETIGAMREWVKKVRADREAMMNLVHLNIARQPEDINDAIRESGLTKEAFWYILHHFGVAVLWPYAAHFSAQIRDDKWQRPRCPICGNEPTMAGLVGEGGQRHLLCNVCNYVWTYQRIKCPYCGNEDPETLKVLATGSDTMHRLDACKKCGRYVKTIDYRRADLQQPIILPIEDAATVYLDILAGNEGFLRD